MTESASHRRAKSKAAGKSGSTETPLKGRRRLDASTANRATEVERSGTAKGLEAAARRLRDSGKSQNTLQVPKKDMSKAVNAMKQVGAKGSVKNMSGTKRRSV